MCRTALSPATVCRNADVAEDVRQRRASARKNDIERQASEITRLVKLAELYAARDAARRQKDASSTTTMTTARTERATTGDTQRQRSATSGHNDVIIVPVVMTTSSVSATTSDGRRHRRPAQSPHTLLHVVDVKSLERCPKCHKVRLDNSSTSQDVGAEHLQKPATSGRNNRRSVRFKAVVSGPQNIATSGRSRSGTALSKPTDAAVGVKTTSSAFSTLTPSRRSSISTVPRNGVISRSQGQGQGRKIPASSGVVVTPSAGDGRQDINNNDQSGHGTWPRNAAACKPPATSAGDHEDLDAGHSSRVRFLGWRKRGSLSAVQQVWADQSSQKTTADSQVDDKPPSAASSYDPLDTDDDTADRR